jgi:hypothetical protein
MISRLAGVCVTGLFTTCMFFSSHGRGMLTIAVIAYVVKLFIPAVWGVVEPFLSAQTAEIQPQVSARPQPKSSRRRWVMPLQTCLPSQLVMQEVPEDGKKTV